MVAVVGRKKGGHTLDRVRGGGLHGGRVVFELDKVVAAGDDNRAGGLVVGVAGVAADQRVGQVGRGEECAGGGHFMLFLGGEVLKAGSRREGLLPKSHRN